jgi:hypothetical protein
MFEDFKSIGFNLESIWSMNIHYIYGDIVCKREDDQVMEYISAPEAAKKWGISERRVQTLCLENRIPDVVRFSRMWLIPKDVDKPVDGGYTRRK